MTIPLIRPDRIEPGSIAWLRPGEEIQVVAPPAEQAPPPEYRPLTGREPLPSELPRPEAAS